jgi:large subunit ribosomal protein L17
MAIIELVEALTVRQQAVGEAERARGSRIAPRKAPTPATRESAVDLAKDSPTAAAVAAAPTAEAAEPEAATPEPAEPTPVEPAAVDVSDADVAVDESAGAVTDPEPAPAAEPGPVDGDETK